MALTFENGFKIFVRLYSVLVINSIIFHDIFANIDFLTLSIWLLFSLKRMIYMMFSTLSKKLPYSIRVLANFEVKLLFLKERKVLKSFSKGSTSLANIYIYIYMYIYICLATRQGVSWSHNNNILKFRDLESIYSVHIYCFYSCIQPDDGVLDRNL